MMCLVEMPQSSCFSLSSTNPTEPLSEHLLTCDAFGHTKTTDTRDVDYTLGFFS